MDLEQRLDKFEQKMENSLAEMADAITRLARFEERVSLHAEGQKVQGIRLGQIERDVVELKTQIATNAASISWTERIGWLLLSGIVGAFFLLL